MKRLLLFLIVVASVYNNAHANTCQTDYDDYTSCKPGFYLASGKCELCPIYSAVFTNSTHTAVARGTSKDYNDGSITSCYFAAGTILYDASGKFTITEKCNYTK